MMMDEETKAALVELEQRVYANKVYSIVKAECGEMDAIYKDYICHLVGIIGLNALVSQKLVEACGVVEGRQLYVLCERGL